MYTFTDRDLNDLESQGCCVEQKWNGLFSTVATYMKSKMPQDIHDLIKALGHYRSGPEGSHRYMYIHLESNHFLYLNHASTVTVYMYSVYLSLIFLFYTVLTWECFSADPLLSLTTFTRSAISTLEGPMETEHAFYTTRKTFERIINICVWVCVYNI